MSDDFFVDFSKEIFGGVVDIFGGGPITKTIGKIAIEALSEDMTEDKKKLIKKIENTKGPVKLTPDEVPILRRAINRTVDILTFGRVHNVLEGHKK